MKTLFDLCVPRDDVKSGGSKARAWRGRLWARVATQIYNERADVERLASAVETTAARPPL